MDEEGKAPREAQGEASIGDPPAVSKVTWRSFARDAKVWLVLPTSR